MRFLCCGVVVFLPTQFLFRVLISVVRKLFSLFPSFLQFSRHTQQQQEKTQKKMADTSMDYSEYSENENSPMVAPKVNIASTHDAHRSSSFSSVYYYYYRFGLS